MPLTSLLPVPQTSAVPLSRLLQHSALDGNRLRGYDRKTPRPGETLLSPEHSARLRAVDTPRVCQAQTAPRVAAAPVDPDYRELGVVSGRPWAVPKVDEPTHPRTSRARTAWKDFCLQNVLRDVLRGTKEELGRGTEGQALGNALAFPHPPCLAPGPPATHLAIAETVYNGDEKSLWREG